MPRNKSGDSFRMTGTLLLLVRSLQQRLRDDTGADLDLADLSVLRQIERGRDLPSAVARALRLDPGRVSRIVESLETKGYVAREQDPDDRRCWHLHLSDAGAQRLNRGKDDIRAVMASLLQGLSADEMAALETGLESVRRELDAGVPARRESAELTR